MCTERRTFPTSCRMHRRKRPGRAPCIRSKILSPPYFLYAVRCFYPPFFSDIIIAIQLTSQCQPEFHQPEQLPDRRGEVTYGIYKQYISLNVKVQQTYQRKKYDLCRAKDYNYYYSYFSYRPRFIG